MRACERPGVIVGASAAGSACEARPFLAYGGSPDAGLALGQVDGLLINAGKSGGLDLSLARHLGLQNLRLLLELNAFGASAAIMVAQAATAVVSGAAEVVACVFADTPRREGVASG